MKSSLVIVVVLGIIIAQSLEGEFTVTNLSSKAFEVLHHDLHAQLNLRLLSKGVLKPTLLSCIKF